MDDIAPMDLPAMMQNSGGNDDEQAIFWYGKGGKTGKGGKPGLCFNCGQPGHLASNCLKGKGKGKSVAKCWNCGLPGHRAHECSVPGVNGSGWPKGKGKGKSSSGKNSAYALGSWDGWADDWTENPGPETADSQKPSENAEPAKTDQTPTFVFSLTHSEKKSGALPLGILTPKLPHLNTMQRGEVEKPEKILVESFLDSGAARSVCPQRHCEQFGLDKSTAGTSREDGFQTATGKQVTRMGTRIVTGHTEDGKGVQMKYAVANISVPLDSISQICDAGATVLFTSTGGTINLANGEKMDFERRDNTYFRKMWVDRNPAPTSFTRQGQMGS